MWKIINTLLKCICINKIILCLYSSNIIIWGGVVGVYFSLSALKSSPIIEHVVGEIKWL